MPNDHYRMGFTFSDSLGLVMTGSSSVTPDSTSTVDGSTFDSATVPPLPSGNFAHCMAHHDGTLYSLGGYVSYNQSRSAFSWRQGQSSWQSLPDLRYSRSDSGCGVATNAAGKSFLIVAGGEGAETSTEMLDLSTMDAWTEGPVLPEPVWSTGSVAYGSTFALVGGGSFDPGLIYTFDPEDVAWVKVASESLTEGRAGLVAMIVDKKIFPEC